MLALRDRRLDRALIADLHRAGLRKDAGGDGQGQVARRDKRHLAAAAQLDLGRADVGARLEQRLRLPGVEAPLHQPNGFVDPLGEAVEPGDDHDEPTAVLLGGTGKAVAGLFGMAGFQAVGARRPFRAADCGCPG